MDSPVRKQQKRNDYLRHKMFRKINRRKKAERKQAIEAPMKELRRRLRRYDGGKKPNDDEPVTNYQIPFIKDKQIKLSNAGLATGAVLSTNLLDTIADNAFRANLPLKTAMGLAVKESTLGNPTDDRSMRTLLNKKKQKELIEQLQEMYGLQYNQQFGQHINYGNAVPGKELINYWRGVVENRLEPPFTTSDPDRKSVVQKAFEFYNESPHKYNPGQKNYQKLVNKRGEELYNSPEYQKWLDEYSQKKVEQYIMRPQPYLQNIELGFKNGKSSGIYIKPQNRGKFTALKKRTGKSASWFKAHGTPAQKKMATFALNAKKWKH